MGTSRMRAGITSALLCPPILTISADKGYFRRPNCFDPTTRARPPSKEHQRTPLALLRKQARQYLSITYARMKLKKPANSRQTYTGTTSKIKFVCDPICSRIVFPVNRKDTRIKRYCSLGECFLLIKQRFTREGCLYIKQPSPFVCSSSDVLAFVLSQCDSMKRFPGNLGQQFGHSLATAEMGEGVRFTPRQRMDVF